jgi:hypothetical protein
VNGDGVIDNKDRNACEKPEIAVCNTGNGVQKTSTSTLPYYDKAEISASGCFDRKDIDQNTGQA